MGTQVLMIGDDRKYLSSNRKMLLHHGFSVRTCFALQDVNDMIEKTKPDILFINTEASTQSSLFIYNQLLDNIRYASIPLVYTLSENDVYLVNLKRTAVRSKRHLQSDNVVDALLLAIQKSLSYAA